MRNVIIMLLVAFVIAGCPTHVVSSDERSVIVESQALNMGDAQKYADAECAKHKRSAKMTSKASYWNNNYIFECVVSDSPSNKADVTDTANKTTPQQLRDPQTLTPPQQLPSNKAAVIDTANKTILQQFRDLQALKNEGLISDEEYQQKKKQLLEHL